MANDKIYLSKAGYEQFQKELEELQNQLTNNSKSKSDAFISAVGDGWHDNFEFENAKREELRIQGLIRQKMEKMSQIVVIDEALDESLIDVDDYINVDMIYDVDDTENITFKLVGSSTPNMNSAVQEVSLNSPLGKAVYGKKIGEEVSYKTEQLLIKVIINRKSKNIEDINNFEQEKVKCKKI